MRNILISIAAATSALAVAAPAAAQYYPAPPPGYGYGNQGAYGQQGYGYQNNWGMVRSLQARVDNLQRTIRQLDQRRLITNREARSLRDQSRAIEYRLRETARNGLSQRERYALETRIARLEQRIHHEARDGRRNWRGNDNRYGQSAYGYDRDRDGRDDRYEDDRGRDRDDD